MTATGLDMPLPTTSFQIGLLQKDAKEAESLRKLKLAHSHVRVEAKLAGWRPWQGYGPTHEPNGVRMLDRRPSVEPKP